MPTGSSGSRRRIVFKFLVRQMLFLGGIAINIGSIRFLFSFQANANDATQSFPDFWSPSPPASTSKNQNDTIKIALYITTHFSDAHIRFFHCCWPRLVQSSPLIRQSHVIIAATNATPVPPEELHYLEHILFAKQLNGNTIVPRSYQFWTPPVTNGNATTTTGGSVASHLEHCEPYKKIRHNKKNVVSVSYKQCLANYGVAFGWSRLVSENYDWMIRINPDVLIRQSKWLLQAMHNSTLDAVLVHCGPKTRQIHTDFWAIRLASFAFQPTTAITAKEISINNKNYTAHQNNNRLLDSPFQHMAKIGIHLNHERTAFQRFRHILASKRYTGVPHVDSSQGICRVRGDLSYVSHEHNSTTADGSSCIVSKSTFHGGHKDEDDDHRICHGLDGWDLTQ